MLRRKKNRILLNYLKKSNSPIAEPLETMVERFEVIKLDTKQTPYYHDGKRQYVVLLPKNFCVGSTISKTIVDRIRVGYYLAVREDDFMAFLNALNTIGNARGKISVSEGEIQFSFLPNIWKTIPESYITDPNNEIPNIWGDRMEGVWYKPNSAKIDIVRFILTAMGLCFPSVYDEYDNKLMNNYMRQLTLDLNDFSGSEIFSMTFLSDTSRTSQTSWRIVRPSEIIDFSGSGGDEAVVSFFLDGSKSSYIRYNATKNHLINKDGTFDMFFRDKKRSNEHLTDPAGFSTLGIDLFSGISDQHRDAAGGVQRNGYDADHEGVRIMQRTYHSLAINSINEIVWPHSASGGSVNNIDQRQNYLRSDMGNSVNQDHIIWSPHAGVGLHAFPLRGVVFADSFMTEEECIVIIAGHPFKFEPRKGFVINLAAYGSQVFHEEDFSETSLAKWRDDATLEWRYYIDYIWKISPFRHDYSDTGNRDNDGSDFLLPPLGTKHGCSIRSIGYVDFATFREAFGLKIHQWDRIVLSPGYPLDTMLMYKPTPFKTLWSLIPDEYVNTMFSFDGTPTTRNYLENGVWKADKWQEGKRPWAMLLPFSNRENEARWWTVEWYNVVSYLSPWGNKRLRPLNNYSKNEFLIPHVVMEGVPLKHEQLNLISDVINDETEMGFRQPPRLRDETQPSPHGIKLVDHAIPNHPDNFIRMFENYKQGGFTPESSNVPDADVVTFGPHPGATNITPGGLGVFFMDPSEAWKSLNADYTYSVRRHSHTTSSLGVNARDYTATPWNIESGTGPANYADQETSFVASPDIGKISLKYGTLNYRNLVNIFPHNPSTVTRNKLMPMDISAEQVGFVYTPGVRRATTGTTINSPQAFFASSVSFSQGLNLYNDEYSVYRMTGIQYQGWSWAGQVHNIDKVNRNWLPFMTPNHMSVYLSGMPWFNTNITKLLGSIPNQFRTNVEVVNRHEGIRTMMFGGAIDRDRDLLHMNRKGEYGMGFNSRSLYGWYEKFDPLTYDADPTTYAAIHRSTAEIESMWNQYKFRFVNVRRKVKFGPGVKFVLPLGYSRLTNRFIQLSDGTALLDGWVLSKMDMPFPLRCLEVTADNRNGDNLKIIFKQYSPGLNKLDIRGREAALDPFAMNDISDWHKEQIKPVLEYDITANNLLIHQEIIQFVKQCLKTHFMEAELAKREGKYLLKKGYEDLGPLPDSFVFSRFKPLPIGAVPRTAGGYPIVTHQSEVKMMPYEEGQETSVAEKTLVFISNSFADKDEDEDFIWVPTFMNNAVAKLDVSIPEEGFIMPSDLTLHYPSFHQTETAPDTIKRFTIGEEENTIELKTNGFNYVSGKSISDASWIELKQNTLSIKPNFYHFLSQVENLLVPKKTIPYQHYPTINIGNHVLLPIRKVSENSYETIDRPETVLNASEKKFLPLTTPVLTGFHGSGKMQFLSDLELYPSILKSYKGYASEIMGIEKFIPRHWRMLQTTEFDHVPYKEFSFLNQSPLGGSDMNHYYELDLDRDQAFPTFSIAFKDFAIASVPSGVSGISTTQKFVISEDNNPLMSSGLLTIVPSGTDFYVKINLGGSRGEPIRWLNLDGDNALINIMVAYTRSPNFQPENITSNVKIVIEGDIWLDARRYKDQEPYMVARDLGGVRLNLVKCWGPMNNHYNIEVEFRGEVKVSGLPVDRYAHFGTINKFTAAECNVSFKFLNGFTLDGPIDDNNVRGNDRLPIVWSQQG